jgi:hypothetical protein
MSITDEGIRYGFYTASAYHNGNFMAGGSIVGAMNTLILRARHMSLGLVIAAVVVHGHLQAANSSAAPGSSGLTRLNRDLMRLAGSSLRPQRDRLVQQPHEGRGQ